MNKRIKFEVISNYVLTFLTLAFIFMLLVYEFSMAETYAESLEGWEGLWALGFVIVYILLYIPTAIVLIVMFILMLCFSGGLLGRAKAQKIVLSGGELPKGRKNKAPSLVGLIVVKFISAVLMIFGTILAVSVEYATVLSWIFYPACTLLMLASAVVSCINHKKVKNAN